MIVYDTITETRSFAERTRQSGKTIGFVPTMGALHEGHLSLVRKAKQENDVVIVSIFVNPIQFNNPDDLKKYPRTLENDLNMLAAVNCDAVFNPSVQEMYPEKVEKTYDFGELANVMEGAFRPGHFNGVAVVVQKLFEITLPHKAYFGEKDYQQLQIIKALVKIEKLSPVIVACPISREKDGLARSSRNERLTPAMRAAAPYIHMVLEEARSLSTAHNAIQIINFVVAKFSDHPLLKLEYFSISDGETLQPVSGTIHPGNYGFIAVFAGEIRLIDNIRLI
ncbi:MAG: pantoate--beta-alanine ligase [Bacteroidales bacterium]|nr:pantoate--beta-alanine ligase [Bacteroidales bacterium]